jgi:hypothetical protein
VLTRFVYIGVQTYMAESRVWMWEVILTIDW